MLQVVGIKNCNKMRDTFKLLDQNGVRYQFIDIKKTPLDLESLSELSRVLGLDVLINKKGRTWKSSGLSEKDLTDDQLLEELFEKQVMIKRPLLVNDGAAMVGFDEDAIKMFLGMEDDDAS